MKVTEYFIARKFLNLYKSAETRGIEFDLSLASVRNLCNAKRCYYTGVELNHVPDHPYQMTVDRVDNTKGYVKGNVVACTKEFNQMKGCLTIKDIKTLYRKCCKE